MIRRPALLTAALCAFALAQAAPAVPAPVEQLRLLFKDFQPPLNVSFAGGRVIVTGRITTAATRSEFQGNRDTSMKSPLSSLGFDSPPESFGSASI